MAATSPPDWWRDRAWWLALTLAVPVALLLIVARQRGVAMDFRGSWWMFVLVFPVLEELVFRGLIQGYLRRYSFLRDVPWWQISYASLITSLLFAAAHLLRPGDQVAALWAASTFAPSLVFGWARDRYGRVDAAIALHIAYNAGFAVVVSVQ